MPTTREVAMSIFGAYRLARFDPAGMAMFDTSIAGVWRSFFAAVIVAPVYALLLTIRYPMVAEHADPARFVLAESIGYVTTWVAFPVVMANLAPRLDCWDRFPAYLCAYNWSMVLQNAAFLPIALLSMSQMVPPDAVLFLWLIVFGLILAYVWFIARTALDLPPVTSAGVVALDVGLSYFISAVAESLY